MALRNAALLAFVATLLLAVYLTIHFVFAVAHVAEGLTPAADLISTFIYTFAGICLAVFFLEFQKKHN